MIFLIFSLFTHTHIQRTYHTGTNDKGLERAARCAEKLQRLGESEENWISLVQRVRKDRARVLRRARGLVRTISDLENKQSFEDVERVRKLCSDIHSICNEIDSMIVEKITTSELHDLHVQCLESRARVLRRIQSSKMMEAGLEAGLARLASAENSPQPESSQHVSKAVEWLRAAAKTLESKRQQSGEDQQYRDTQIRVLVSLGDAYVVFSSVGFNNITHSLNSYQNVHSNMKKTLKHRYAFRVLKGKRQEKALSKEDHEFAISCYRQAHRLATRFGKSRLAHMALENLFVHLCETREFREAKRIEKELCILEGRDVENDSEEAKFLVRSLCVARSNM